MLRHAIHTTVLLRKAFVGLVLSSLLLGMLGAAASPATAQAQTQTVQITEVECGTFDVFCSIGKGIAALLNGVSELVGWLIRLFAEGIILLISYSTKVVSFPAVTAGFQVTLGVVNLLFVMSLIIIAFQIILGYHEGDAKKRLAKIILAALLVNFSMLIAGFLLDISNVFTAFFVKSVTSDNLRIALNPHQFQALHQLSSANTGQFFDSVAPAMFRLFMSGIILIILIAVFATILVRILWVACLLLVMPLTWAFWVFPGLESYHHDWWKNFMKWGVTLMPTMTFFLYIGIQTVNQMANWTGRAPSADGTIQGTLNGIIQMLIIGGIMVAGLKIGISAGGISATAALGAAGKVTGMAAKPLMGARMRVGGREYGIKPGAQRVAGWGAGILNRVGNVPVLGAVTGARYGAAALSKVGHADEHDAQEYQKNVLKDLNDHDLFAFKGKNRIEDAAHLKELAARKKVGDFINDSHANRDDRVAQLQRLTAAAGTNNHKSGSDLTDIQEVKEALDSVPTLAPQLLGNRPGVVPPTPVRTITEQFARMTPNKIAELHPSTFDPMSPAGREALAAVGNNPSAIKSIFTNGSEQLRERISTGLNAMLDNAIPDPADRATYRGVRDRLESLDSDLSNARARNDNAAVANLQLERENLRTMVDPIIGRLDAAGEAQARAALNGENARIQVINRTTGNLV